MGKLLVLVAVMITLPQIAFAEYKDNDTLKFWSVSYADWMTGELPAQKEISAVCKKVGKYSYIFQDTKWVVDIPDSVINYYSETFDDDYYRLTDLYGPVPNALDNDSRIFILIIDPDWWSGYFDPIQQMPDSMTMRIWKVHSTEREIIYISGRSFNKNSTSIIAHEFGHMLQWGNDHDRQDDGNTSKYWEDIWVDEGFSTFASMYLTEGVSKLDVFNSNPFFSSNTNLSLIHFENSDNYSSSLLFMLYMYEHFGGDNYIRTLIGNKLNGIEGVRSTLEILGYGISFNDVFRNWAIANYLDNKDAGTGQYYYRHYDFPACKIRKEFNYTAMQYTDSLKAYSTHYFSFAGITDSLFSISVSALDSSRFTAALIKFDTTGSSLPKVEFLNVGINITSFLVIDRQAEPFDELVFVAMNIDPDLAIGNSARYEVNLGKYEKPSVIAALPDEEISAGITGGQLILDFGKLNLNGIIADLFNINGNIVSSLKPNSTGSIIDMSSFAQGLYILRIKSGNTVLFRKISNY